MKIRLFIVLDEFYKSVSEKYFKKSSKDALFVFLSVSKNQTDENIYVEFLNNCIQCNMFELKVLFRFYTK